jgi:hypothetical protein
MAYLKQMASDTQLDIARQLGDRIAEEFQSAATAVPPAPIDGVEQPSYFSPLAGIDRATARFKLAETFEVWKLRADAGDDLARTGEDLVTLARATGAYRHQVRLVRDGKKTAIAFAHSYARGVDLGERVVRDFFFSSLAADIDDAVRLADALIPEAAAARLLSLPEFKTEALWFVSLSEEPAPRDGAQPQRTITTRGVIVASAPPSFPGQTMSLMDSSTFIRALSGTSRGMGLLL